MASTSKNGRPDERAEVKAETEVKAKVEADENHHIVVVDAVVHCDVLASHFEKIGVTEDGDDVDGEGADGEGADGDDGDDDFLGVAIEAILPICGGCYAGTCRYGITESGRVYLKCCIKEGFGACGFFKWLDPQDIAESQKRIQEIAKKQG